jgi:glycosyltransferase involved in cell wall biosynthesis
MERSEASGISQRVQPATPEPLRVLNLVTKPRPFYRQQVAALEEIDVSSTTIAVPGTHHRGDDTAQSRSAVDYLRFYPTVLRESLGEYDLVHANYGLTGPAAIAQSNRTVVLSLWGSDLHGRYGTVSKWCARLADAVIVMSEEMASAVPTDCYVIPHGVDFGLFRPASQSDAQADLGWDPAIEHVLFPYATTRPEKDFPRAERVVEAASRRLGADIELHAMHDVAHDRMPVYMNAADSLLLTSKHEGSPNSVKEALACDLPVVSTDVGDVHERLATVEPSGVGQTEDELVSELVTVLERDTRSNGREQSRPLSTEQTAEQIRDVYEQVLS